PGTGLIELSPSFRRTVTTPKQVADRIGNTRSRERNPTRRPPAESRTVPSTMTTVPATIAIVTRSPRSRMARPEEMNGYRLLRAAVTEAPNLVDADEAQQAAGHRAHEPREDEEGDAPGLQGLERTSHQHRRPEAYGPHRQVDPVPPVGIASPEPLPDQDGGGGRGQGAGQREDMNRARHQVPGPPRWSPKF